MEKGREFAKATKKEKKVLAVEKLVSLGRPPGHSPTISKIGTGPTVLRFKLLELSHMEMLPVSEGKGKRLFQRRLGLQRPLVSMDD